MPPNVRQKACFGCASSKRRCDKQLPECQRCLDRDVDCIYPLPKRQRRTLQFSDTIQFPTLPLFINDEASVDAGFDIDPWADLAGSDVDFGFVEKAETRPLESACRALESYEGRAISHAPKCWFLGAETWVMHVPHPHPECPEVFGYEPYVDSVRSMLHRWLTDGHNSFIHHKLYEGGLPVCMQDAFTTMAAYVHRTSSVKNVVLQIADERATALSYQATPTERGAKGVLAHLARVQAFFVYSFIRLFDGAVHSRASAEKQLPTLRAWLAQLWGAARGLKEHDNILDGAVYQLGDGSSNQKSMESPANWRLWVLVESVRRSLLVMDTILNTYQAMTVGWAECTGGVMVTARRGLWEAASAVRWAALCNKESPLMVPSLEIERLMAEHAADEVDDFVKTLWKFIVGPEKVQGWIDLGEKLIKA